MNNRIGFGYDIHRLAEGEELWLGGLLIPAKLGAVGHSDADVLIHAISDALIGALALGDIGSHFPDTEEQFEGIDSKLLLAQVMKLIRDKGYELVNIDSTVVLEKPKLRPHIDKMREKLSEVIQCQVNQISIKATTSERIGFAGRQEGIKAYAVVLLQLVKSSENL